MNHTNILIQNGENIYIPVIEEGIEWELERKGSPREINI